MEWKIESANGTVGENKIPNLLSSFLELKDGENIYFFHFNEKKTFKLLLQRSMSLDNQSKVLNYKVVVEGDEFLKDKVAYILINGKVSTVSLTDKDALILKGATVKVPLNRNASSISFLISKESGRVKVV